VRRCTPLPLGPIVVAVSDITTPADKMEADPNRKPTATAKTLEVRPMGVTSGDATMDSRACQSRLNACQVSADF